MSILFRYLRRARKAKPAVPLGELLQVQILDLPEGDPGKKPDEPPVPGSSEVAPVRAPVPARAGFSLDLADQRIKIVLDPLTMPGEQFRFLRARLDQLQRQNGLKILLVTSSVPGEGKTFTACCLAGILAQEPDKRTLLVDADLRKPKAAENLGMDQNGAPEGLSQILQGRAELEHVLLRSETLDFLFLPAGPVPSHPSELLASNNLERVIQRMAAMSDWVVIDAPPILSLADATRLAPLCDAVLLVVQANATPAKIVNRAIQQIGRERVAGIVLNRVKQHHSSAYYYKSYSKQGRGK